ncbi:MAG: peroxiredoxin family protein [Roseibacillus sp.]
MRSLMILLALFASGAALAGSPRLAAEIKKEYELATAQWAQKLRGAADADQQMAIWRQRPNASEYAQRMWAELRSSLREEWSMDYSAWLLEYAPVFAAGVAGPDRKAPVQSIMRAVERFHLKSEKVGLLCLALTSLPDPKILALVEKVSKENPDEAVQGQAAMAIAMLLKGLGEDRDIMVRRLTRLREAIIKANDVKVGDVTVAKLAEDEIFVIQNLAKGRTAPDIVGRDSAGKPFKFSLLKSKVTVLVFWHSNMRDAERGLGLLRKLHKQHGHRGMELIGVTSDPLEVLRNLRSKGTIPWRNFSDVSGRIAREYRVRTLPIVYVLNENREIQFIGGPGAFVDLTVEALLAE